MWVESPLGSPSCACLISQHCQDPYILNADLDNAQPRCLKRLLSGAWWAYMGRDGYLRLVGVMARTLPCTLWWHAADTVTGQILSSQPKHSWALPLDQLSPIYHAASHQVLAMSGQGVVVVMDAETLQDIVHIHVGQGSLKQPLHLQDLEWSQTSSLLAVSCRGPPEAALDPWLQYTFHILIYDTSTGTCLQSVDIPANEAQIAWSSSRNLLAVFFQAPFLLENDDELTEAFGSAYHGQGIQVLDPSHGHVGVVPSGCFAEECAFETSAWTPCGRLIVVRGVCLLANNCDEYLVFEPDSPALIHKLEAEGQLSWAPINGCQDTLSAYLPWAGCLVTFHYGPSGWQARRRHLPHAGLSDDAAFSPCGKYLVLRADACKRLYLYNLDEEVLSLMASYPRCHFWPASGSVPLPWGWRQVFAYVHHQKLPGGVQRTPSAALMDGASHTLLGSWTLPDLLNTAGPSAGTGIRNQYWTMPGHFMWACNGKHLAFTSSVCNVVMTFRQQGCK